MNVPFSQEDGARAVAITRFLGHLFLVDQLDYATPCELALVLVSGICHTGPQRAAVHMECLCALMSMCRSKIDDRRLILGKLARLRASRAANGQACFSKELRAKMQAMIEEECSNGENP